MHHVCSTFTNMFLCALSTILEFHHLHFHPRTIVLHSLMHHRTHFHGIQWRMGEHWGIIRQMLIQMCDGPRLFLCYGGKSITKIIMSTYFTSMLHNKIVDHVCVVWYAYVPPMLACIEMHKINFSSQVLMDIVGKNVQQTNRIKFLERLMSSHSETMKNLIKLKDDINRKLDRFHLAPR